MDIYLDNIIFSLQKAGGISVYWHELAKRFVSSKYRPIMIEQNDSGKNIFRSELNIDEKKIIRENGLPLGILRYLPLRVKIGGHSIFHSSYYRVSRQRGIANIVTVHDFIYEYFRKGLPKYLHGLQKRYAIKNASGIICVSEHTKKDLLRFYPSIPEARIKVIYHGVAEEFSPIQKDPRLYPDLSRILTRKYILYVGRRDRHKNFDVVVDVLSDLTDYDLVVAGGKELSETERSDLDARLRNRFHYLEHVDNSELNILYNFAFCTLYPSSYEGFGMPILESMKAACPVITTKMSAIPEVAGIAGMTVDRIDRGECAAKIKMLEVGQARENIVRLGSEQASKFSWDKCFEETVSFYEKVYQGRFRRLSEN
ncbi:MAG: glycosyltransferase family 1 protein [Pseudomonadota bacterium]